MEKVIFSKYSIQRRKELQIETKIVEKDGRLTVQKRGIYDSGHVDSLLYKKKLLKGIYSDQKDVRVCECDSVYCGLIEFEYVEGRNLEDIIIEYAKNRNLDGILRIVERFYEILCRAVSTQQFMMSDMFHEIFGEVAPRKNLACSRISNLDMVFSNIIVNDKFTIVDYEWVYELVLPVQYILYRSLLLSYGITSLNKEEQNEIYEHFCITEEDRKTYWLMEKNFQIYVLGNVITQRKILEKIGKPAVSWGSVKYRCADEHIPYVRCVAEMSDGKRCTILKELLEKDFVELSIKITKEMHRLYLYPVETFSIIKLIKLSALDMQGCKKPINIIQDNAPLSISDDYYFTGQCPEWVFENRQYQQIDIQYQILRHNETLVQNIVDYILQKREKEIENEILRKECDRLAELCNEGIVRTVIRKMRNL